MLVEIKNKRTGFTSIAMLSALLLCLVSLPGLAPFNYSYNHTNASFQNPVQIMSNSNLVTSLNWAGYAVTAGKGSVSDVKGSWIVPTANCANNQNSKYSSFWVGIDGYNSNTVEQTGTDSDCRTSTAVYYAWYEFFPKASVKINALVVHPGDAIYAEVKYSPLTQKFTLTITDTTTSQTFSVQGKVTGAARSSAEWIAEAPSSLLGILPLANFGTVNFGANSTSLSMTCYATIKGVAHPIGQFPSSSIQQINMATKSGIMKAQTSALSQDGTSFSVQWQHS